MAAARDAHTAPAIPRVVRGAPPAVLRSASKSGTHASRTAIDENVTTTTTSATALGCGPYQM